MKKIYVYMVALALTAGACTNDELVVRDERPEASEPVIPGDATEGELLIKFVPEMTELLDRTQTTRAAGVATRSGIPSTDEVLAILGAYQFERVFPVNPATEDRAREAGMHLWYLVRFDKGTDVSEAADRLAKLGEVSKVQCNRTIQRAYRTDRKPVTVTKEMLTRGTRAAAEFPFNDPLIDRQWGYINHGGLDFERDWAATLSGSDVNCEEAWKLSTGDPSIIVAVLDEAVMWSHPDLQANMWVNKGEIPGNGIDDDGNGYIDDVYGFNFVKNNGSLSWTSNSDTGHGTHVAGTIAAVNNNGIGVGGIAGGVGADKPGAKIMSCQLFDGDYLSTLAGEAKAIKYAADNGAVVLQCSWGYNSALANIAQGFMPGPASEEEWATLYPLEKEVLDYFIHNAGSPNGVIDGGLAIFASGNESAGMSAFPAAYSGCISVSSIAADFTPSTFSNFGVEVDLSAPGGDSDYYGMSGMSDDGDFSDSDLPGAYDKVSYQGTILSTLVINGQPGYGYFEGTSMACPHVSGVVALGLSYAAQQRRHFTAQEFKKLLLSTGKDLDQYYDGEKLYHYNHSTPGTSATRMDLNAYRGKMGRLADAGALLHAIDGSGSDMHVPNVYVAPEKTVSVDLSRYFLKGESLNYSCTVVNGTIASVSVEGSVLRVSGLSVGVTQAKIKVSDGKEQTITITVRKNANDNGWM